MTESPSRLANFFLRHSSVRARLRRLPVLGALFAWIANKILPRGTLVWAQIQNGPGQGLWMRLNPRTAEAVQQSTGEPQMQQALVEHLRPGMTFYDLGANIGFFSLIAARLVGSSGRVVSFEADPEIACRLQENLQRNNFSHAVVEQKAVWSETAPVSFARVDASASPDRGLGHVAANTSKSSLLISVEAVSLDDYSLSHPAPDMIKCDVEGAEREVFQGAQRLLREKRSILLVEMHSPENYRALIQKFAEFGYSCRNLDENHVLALPR